MLVKSLHYSTERGDNLDLRYLNVLGMAAIKIQSLHYYVSGIKDPKYYSKVYRPTIESIIQYGIPREHIVSWAIRSAIIDEDTIKLNKDTAPVLMPLE